jgi:hypothetical protein
MLRTWPLSTRETVLSLALAIPIGLFVTWTAGLMFGDNPRLVVTTETSINRLSTSVGIRNQGDVELTELSAIFDFDRVRVTVTTLPSRFQDCLSSTPAPVIQLSCPSPLSLAAGQELQLLFSSERAHTLEGADLLPPEVTARVFVPQVVVGEDPSLLASLGLTWPLVIGGLGLGIFSSVLIGIVVGTLWVPHTNVCTVWGSGRSAIQ